MIANANVDQTESIAGLLTKYGGPFSLEGGPGGVRYLTLLIDDEEVRYSIDLDGEIQGALPPPDDRRHAQIEEEPAMLAPRVTDTNEDGSPAITFEPWTDGHALGFKVTRHADGGVGYVYLNPSQDTFSDGALSPDVFVYTGTNGDPALDSAYHFYNIEFEFSEGRPAPEAPQIEPRDETES